MHSVFIGLASLSCLQKLRKLILCLLKSLIETFIMLQLSVFGVANITAKLSDALLYICQLLYLFEAIPAIFILGKIFLKALFFYINLRLNCRIRLFILENLFIFQGRKLVLLCELLFESGILQ